MLQCALGALTLFAVTSLVFSGVRYGLLASPDMGVTGPGSGGNTFSWFVDRATPTLPQPVVYSLPLWVYRTIMFAWANMIDRKSTRLNSSHSQISYAVFCLKKKKTRSHTCDMSLTSL